MFTLKQLRDNSDDPRLLEFIGKRAIVSIHQFYEQYPLTWSQDFGEIIDIEDGLMVLQLGEKSIYFPGQFDAFVLAPRGMYKLKSSAEEISNPEILVSWRLDLEDNQEESHWQANTAPHFHSIVGPEWDFDYTHDQDYLEKVMTSRGKSLTGKTILAGIHKYRVHDDGTRTLAEQTQVFGKIIWLNMSEGVIVELNDGSELSLPPDITLLQVAPPGEYTLQSTGEVIVNPDLMTMWTSEIE